MKTAREVRNEATKRGFNVQGSLRKVFEVASTLGYAYYVYWQDDAGNEYYPNGDILDAATGIIM